MGKKILIVDDAKFMRTLIKKILKDEGYEVVGEADNADDSVEKFKELRPDLITMDICMPNKSGIEAIKEIIKIDKNANILVCSALGQEILVMEALKLGAKDFIVKPFKKEKLLEGVKKVLSTS
ncbi:MAG: response regulator [Promethearchaeota archaeon]